MGGYFAPCAAAPEKRMKAVVANSLLPDVTAAMLAIVHLDPDVPDGDDLEDKVDLSNPMTKFVTTEFKDRCGMAGQSLSAFFAYLGAYNLGGLDEAITCPFLSIAGESEGPLSVSFIRWTAVRRIAP